MHTKKRSKILIILFCFIVFSCFILINPNASFANIAWEAENVLISSVETNDGKLNSLDVHFKVN